MITILECEPTIEGMLSAIYEAWTRAKVCGHDALRIGLHADGEWEPELFCNHEIIATDGERAAKLAESIVRRISLATFETVKYLSLCEDEGRGDLIYRFLIRAFKYGAGVIKRLDDPVIARVFKTERAFLNEAHYHNEFIRFEETSEGILLARIEPKGNVLPMIMPHFADRFPGERLMIIDVGKNLAAAKMPGEPPIYFEMTPEEIRAADQAHEDSEFFANLWRTYFNTVAIRERVNYNLQRNLLRIRYRKHLTEFNSPAADTGSVRSVSFDEMETNDGDRKKISCCETA